MTEDPEETRLRHRRRREEMLKHLPPDERERALDEMEVVTRMMIRRETFAQRLVGMLVEESEKGEEGEVGAGTLPDGIAPDGHDPPARPDGIAPVRADESDRER